MHKHHATNRICQSSMLPFEDFNQGLTPDTLETFKQFVRDTISDPAQIFDQKREALTAAAMRALPYPPVSEYAEQLIADEVIDMIAEGGAPYHPRYVAPYYERLLTNGSKFLELPPARDLHEATAHLLTAYYYIPCGGLPVFIGRLDELLEPYIDTVSEDTAWAVLKSFWLMVDRLNPSAFVHANIGPNDSQVGRMLLKIDREVKTITNLSLRYDPDITPDDFALMAVENQILLTKPYFVNHPMMTRDWGEDYVVASCYNGMRLGGGIYTLVRINFKEMVKLSDGSVRDVLDNVIPQVAQGFMEIVNSRIRYLVDEIGWFDSNVWVREGLLDRERFTAYAGVFGLAEAVNWLMAQEGNDTRRFGQDKRANQLGQQITSRMEAKLAKLPAAYCQGWQGRVSYHAQVGISTDVDVTPGTRIPSGEEPPLYEHVACVAPLHDCIPGGVSTILEFDQTAAGKPQALLDIIKGAMAQGIRILSVGIAQSEFVRVTGYLIRRADLENAKEERANRHTSAALGAGFFETKPNHYHRRKRQV